MTATTSDLSFQLIFVGKDGLKEFTRQLVVKFLKQTHIQQGSPKKPDFKTSGNDTFLSAAFTGLDLSSYDRYPLALYPPARDE